MILVRWVIIPSGLCCIISPPDSHDLGIGHIMISTNEYGKIEYFWITWKISRIICFASGSAYFSSSIAILSVPVLLFKAIDFIASSNSELENRTRSSNGSLGTSISAILGIGFDMSTQRAASS
eukprot:NODE_646_length_5050_cov_1.281155.p4 type:complete len:123 gc:universal NODE_646_length_5050_cov_1.281155:2152-1784(-)